MFFGNLPIFYMTVVDGLGARWFGTQREPGIDLVVSGGAAVLALSWFAWERQKISLGETTMEGKLV